MLLYTRLAPPKVPKRRSRAGCTYCKEKKKKCDEARPQCTRCAERRLACIYEPVKPRQRRKRSELSPSQGALGTSSNSTTNVTASASEEGSSRWHEDYDNVDYDDVGNHPDDFSLEEGFDTGNMFGLDSGLDVPLTSPLATTGFDFTAEMGLGAIQEVEEDVEEIERLSASFPASTSSAVTTVGISTASSIPAFAATSPLLGLRLPPFIEFSEKPNRRALLDHFCNVLSHLIVFREEKGNPFQQLILPLSHRSHPVMNALYALASAHLEYRGVSGPESSVQFHNMAIQGLAKLIEQDDKAKRNELLAAIMLLVYYEVLVQNGRSNIVDGHLKGAMTVIASTAPESTDPTGIFLERAFRFYDVIAALSFGTAPLSAAPAAGYLAPFPPADALAVSTLSNVDTLLGMATTLWPMMHRLSTLLSLKSELEWAIASKQSSKIAVMRTELETTSSAIEVAFKHWQPVLPNNITLPAEDEDTTEEQSRLLSALNNALAYRHSALVYLYRTIHGYPRGHHLVQTHAHVSLTHCVATVSYGGPMGALLWPLFVASCEAISDSDRGMARTAFEAIERRQGMTNIGRAWDIVQEVWKRADVLATTPGSPGPNPGRERDEKWSHLWRRISQDMGVTIVFG